MRLHHGMRFALVVLGFLLFGGFMTVTVSGGIAVTLGSGPAPYQEIIAIPGLVTVSGGLSLLGGGLPVLGSLPLLGGGLPILGPVVGGVLGTVGGIVNPLLGGTLSTLDLGGTLVNLPLLNNNP